MRSQRPLLKPANPCVTTWERPPMKPFGIAARFARALKLLEKTKTGAVIEFSRPLIANDNPLGFSAHGTLPLISRSSLAAWKATLEALWKSRIAARVVESSPESVDWIALHAAGIAIARHSPSRSRTSAALVA